MSKIPKEAVLYLYREGTQYKCLDCPWFLLSAQRCVLHGKDDVIKGYGSCGYWGQGGYASSLEPLGLVTPLESGYMENKPGFSCKRCDFYGGAKIQKCAIVDEKSPGDTPNVIHPDACCNAWQKEKKGFDVANDDKMVEVIEKLKMAV